MGGERLLDANTMTNTFTSWDQIVFALGSLEEATTRSPFRHIASGEGFDRLHQMVEHTRVTTFGRLDYQIDSRDAYAVSQAILQQQFDLWMNVIRMGGGTGLKRPPILFHRGRLGTEAYLFISVEPGGNLSEPTKEEYRGRTNESITPTSWCERWIVREYSRSG